MSIQICWKASLSGPKVFHSVPFLDADLIVTTMNEVVIDCSWQLPSANWPRNDSILAERIQRYLTDPVENHLDVTLYQQGTEYARKVWEILLNIPFGQVMSYSALAQQIGSGPRAVAQACRTNPYAGIIPCHRVIAQSGIGGFMGQSQGPMVQLKQGLLAYERHTALSRL